MLSTVKKLAKASIEIPILRSRAMGMGFIESKIAEAVGSPAIAKIIAKKLGLKELDKKGVQTARRKIKEEYGVDPELETMFGKGGFGGAGGAGGSKRINEIREMLIAAVQSLTSITKKVDNITDQNNQILKAVQSRLTEEIGQIMQKAEPSVAPMGSSTSADESTEAPNWNEKLQRWQDPKSGLIVKPPTQSAATAVPKKQSTIVEKTFEKSVEILKEKSPLFKMLLGDKGKEEGDETGKKPKVSRVQSVLSELKKTMPSNSPETLQPALEGIAKKEPVKSEIEPDELKNLLTEALEDALKQVIADNPDMLKGEGGGGLGGLMDMLPIPGRKSGAKAAGKAAAKKAGVKAGAKIAGKAVLKSALKKIPIVGAIAGLGFAASRAMTGDWAGAAMEAGSGLAGTIPGVGTAASVGIDAALAARDAGILGGGTTPVPPRPEDPQLSTAIPTNSGAEIIEMNRRIQSGEVGVRTTPQGTPIVQRITNNTMLPPAEKKNIEVGNKENTFNRLIAQDFDHPAAYSNFNMG